MATPHEWVRVQSRSTGAYYWSNTVTGESAWELDSKHIEKVECREYEIQNFSSGGAYIVAQWVVRDDGKGGIYFQNIFSGEIRNNSPEDGIIIDPHALNANQFEQTEGGPITLIEPQSEPKNTPSLNHPSNDKSKARSELIKHLESLTKVDDNLGEILTTMPAALKRNIESDQFRMRANARFKELHFLTTTNFLTFDEFAPQAAELVADKPWAAELNPTEISQAYLRVFGSKKPKIGFDTTINGDAETNVEEEGGDSNEENILRKVAFQRILAASTIVTFLEFHGGVSLSSDRKKLMMSLTEHLNERTTGEKTNHLKAERIAAERTKQLTSTPSNSNQETAKSSPSSIFVGFENRSEEFLVEAFDPIMIQQPFLSSIQESLPEEANLMDGSPEQFSPSNNGQRLSVNSLSSSNLRGSNILLHPNSRARVEVFVRRSSAIGAVRVRYGMVPITAKPYKEFIPAFGVLEFLPGESVLSIPIDLIRPTMDSITATSQASSSSPSSAAGASFNNDDLTIRVVKELELQIRSPSFDDSEPTSPISNPTGSTFEPLGVGVSCASCKVSLQFIMPHPLDKYPFQSVASPSPTPSPSPPTRPTIPFPELVQPTLQTGVVLDPPSCQDRATHDQSISRDRSRDRSSDSRRPLSHNSSIRSDVLSDSQEYSLVEQMARLHELLGKPIRRGIVFDDSSSSSSSRKSPLKESSSNQHDTQESMLKAQAIKDLQKEIQQDISPKKQLKNNKSPDKGGQPKQELDGKKVFLRRGKSFKKPPSKNETGAQKKQPKKLFPPQLKQQVIESDNTALNNDSLDSSSLHPERQVKFKNSLTGGISRLWNSLSPSNPTRPPPLTRSNNEELKEEEVSFDSDVSDLEKRDQELFNQDEEEEIERLQVESNRVSDHLAKIAAELASVGIDVNDLTAEQLGRLESEEDEEEEEENEQRRSSFSSIRSSMDLSSNQKLLSPSVDKFEELLLRKKDIPQEDRSRSRCSSSSTQRRSPDQVTTKREEKLNLIARRQHSPLRSSRNTTNPNDATKKSTFIQKLIHGNGQISKEEEFPTQTSNGAPRLSREEAQMLQDRQDDEEFDKEMDLFLLQVFEPIVACSPQLHSVKCTPHVFFKFCGRNSKQAQARGQYLPGITIQELKGMCKTLKVDYLSPQMNRLRKAFKLVDQGEFEGLSKVVEAMAQNDQAGTRRVSQVLKPSSRSISNTKVNAKRNQKAGGNVITFELWSAAWSAHYEGTRRVQHVERAVPDEGSSNDSRSRARRNWLKVLRTVSTARYWSNLTNFVWQENPNEDEVDADDTREIELKPYQPISFEEEEPNLPVRPEPTTKSRPSTVLERSKQEKVRGKDPLRVSMDNYQALSKNDEVKASISEYEAQLENLLYSRETNQIDQIQQSSESGGSLSKRLSLRRKSSSATTMTVSEDDRYDSFTSKRSLDKTMKEWRETTNDRDDIFKEAGKVLGKPVKPTSRRSSVSAPRPITNIGPARRGSEPRYSSSRMRGASQSRLTPPYKQTSSLSRPSSQTNIKSCKVIIKPRTKPPAEYDETF